MKKNTVLAIVLSTIVILASIFIQHKFFPSDEKEISEDKRKVEEVAKKEDVLAKDSRSYPESFSKSFEVIDNKNLKEQEYKIETPLVTVKFTNKGGDIISYKLNNYKETSGEDGVEMIKYPLPNNRAFSLSFDLANTPSFDGLCKVKRKETEKSKIIAFIMDIKDAEKKR